MELVSGIRRYSGLQFGSTIYAGDINSSTIEHKDFRASRVEDSYAHPIYNIANKLPLFAYAYAYINDDNGNEYKSLWTLKHGDKLRELGLVKEYCEFRSTQGQFEEYIDIFLSNFLKKYVKDQNVDFLSQTLMLNMITNFVSPETINSLLWNQQRSEKEIEKLKRIVSVLKPEIKTVDDIYSIIDMLDMPFEWAEKIIG